MLLRIADSSRECPTRTSDARRRRATTDDAVIMSTVTPPTTASAIDEPQSHLTRALTCAFREVRADGRTDVDVVRADDAARRLRTSYGKHDALFSTVVPESADASPEDGVEVKDRGAGDARWATGLRLDDDDDGAPDGYVVGETTIVMRIGVMHAGRSYAMRASAGTLELVDGDASGGLALKDGCAEGAFFGCDAETCARARDVAVRWRAPNDEAGDVDIVLLEGYTRHVRDGGLPLVTRAIFKVPSRRDAPPRVVAARLVNGPMRWTDAVTCDLKEAREDDRDVPIVRNDQRTQSLRSRSQDKMFVPQRHDYFGKYFNGYGVTDYTTAHGEYARLFDVSGDSSYTPGESDRTVRVKVQSHASNMFAVSAGSLSVVGASKGLKQRSGCEETFLYCDVGECQYGDVEIAWSVPTASVGDAHLVAMRSDKLSTHVLRAITRQITTVTGPATAPPPPSPPSPSPSPPPPSPPPLELDWPSLVTCQGASTTNGVDITSDALFRNDVRLDESTHIFDIRAPERGYAPGSVYRFNVYASSSQATMLYATAGELRNTFRGGVPEYLRAIADASADGTRSVDDGLVPMEGCGERFVYCHQRKNECPALVHYEWIAPDHHTEEVRIVGLSSNGVAGANAFVKRQIVVIPYVDVGDANISSRLRSAVTAVERTKSEVDEKAELIQNATERRQTAMQEAKRAKIEARRAKRAKAAAERRLAQRARQCQRVIEQEQVSAATLGQVQSGEDIVPTSPSVSCDVETTASMLSLGALGAMFPSMDAAAASLAAVAAVVVFAGAVILVRHRRRRASVVGRDADESTRLL